MEITTSPFEMFIDYLADKATPEEILAFQLPEDVQERARWLFDANSAGTLSLAEQIELDQLVDFDRMMLRLKARAYRALPSR